MTTPPANDPIGLSARLEGFLLGAVIGGGLAARTATCHDVDAVRRALAGTDDPLPPGPGSRRAGTALADALLEELLDGGVDLRRLAGRWIAWWEEDGEDTPPSLAAALGHLREFDAPIGPPAQPTLIAMAAALPAALTHTNPQAMVAGAFHVAALLDPTEEGALAAVAVVIAASQFLLGRRDFLPEVIACLRANRAPAAMIETIGAIPRDPRTSPPPPRGEEAAPGAALAWLLWTAHHRPRSAKALRQMQAVGGVSPVVGTVLGALLGARDGLATWPGSWGDAAGDEIALRRALAQQLG